MKSTAEFAFLRIDLENVVGPLQRRPPRRPEMRLLVEFLSNAFHFKCHKVQMTKTASFSQEFVKFIAFQMTNSICESFGCFKRCVSGPFW